MPLREKAEEIFVRPGRLWMGGIRNLGIVALPRQHDIYGNAAIGKDVHLFDSKNCIVHTTEERKVVIQGLDGYIVVEQDGKLFICRLSGRAASEVVYRKDRLIQLEFVN